MNEDPKYTGMYHCMNCGYITEEQLDMDTEFLDLHCKCGGAVVRVPKYEMKMNAEDIAANVVEMKSGTMHEVDQLVMMCDTQRAVIINLLQIVRDLRKGV